MVVIAKEARLQKCIALNPSAQLLGPPNIWADHLYMQRLVSGNMPEEAAQAERDRINKRVRRFVYSNGLLHRVFADGSKREVPRPAERADIVKKSHEDSGHFGIKCRVSLVATRYSWHGMYEQVRWSVRGCETSAGVKACFVSCDINLHPLVIMGMFYRWSVDLVGLFRQSYGNYYIMVMVKHFSEWVEVVSLPSKESNETARMFRQYVLYRYGALADVLTDQETEFRGEFQEMSDKKLFEHRRTVG